MNKYLGKEKKEKQHKKGFFRLRVLEAAWLLSLRVTVTCVNLHFGL